MDGHTIPPVPAGALPASTARPATLGRLGSEVFDCVVVGGGITGAGVAREAARRGLSVALVEANDFAAGTSSRSTQLIHGGLRYLAMGDLALVRRTARERQVVHALVPHLAEPSTMVVPARTRGELWALRAGVTLYEKLGGVAKRDRHHVWGRAELGDEEPCLREAGTAYAVAYREYLTHDCRLVLANLRSAVLHGAVVLNYVKVDRVLQPEAKAVGVEARCSVTGETVRIEGRLLVNAAGPWVDATRRMEDPGAQDLLVLSRGIHVALPVDKVPVGHLLMLRNLDGRPLFVIPRGEVVFAGTTDTVHPEGPALWPEIVLEDVEYLLAGLKSSLRVTVRPQDVVAAWAGLRPLVAEGWRSSVKGKAGTPTRISRREEVRVGRAGMVTISGGKLTGYRLMARSAVETGARLHGLPLAPVPTQDEPLPGGDFPDGLDALARGLEGTGITAPCAHRLVRLYGTEARQVVDWGGEPVSPHATLIRGEIPWAIRVEGSETLEDVLYRRTRFAVYDGGRRKAVVEAVADLMATELAWSAERRRREVARAGERMASDLAFARS